jgi:hypothetical protein
MVIGMGALITIAVLAFVGFILIVTGIFTAGVVIAALGFSAVVSLLAIVADSIVSGRWFILISVIVFGMILYLADKRRRARRVQQN